MNETEAIILFLMVVGAFFMPFISRRLMLPSAVGEIIFGMLIGTFINIHSNSNIFIEYFGNFGFLLLMYLAGLELNFDKLRITPKKDIWLYLFMFWIMGCLSILATIYFNYHWSFALIFVTTGLGLLFPVLKDSGLLKLDFGQSLLIIAMIGEILTLIGITLVTMFYKYGFTVNSLINVAYIVAFIIFIYLIMRITKITLWWNPNWQSIFLKVGNPTETGIRANFVILFFFVALASIINIEPVVGAFIGGMLFALVFPGRAGVLEKLEGIGYGFFIPLFFISVGMNFSFSDLAKPSVVIFALIIAGIMLSLRIISSLVLFFTNIRNNKIVLVALGISFPLTMLVAVSSIYYENGIITKDQSSSILLASMITAILYPWLFKILLAIIIPNIDEK